MKYFETDSVTPVELLRALVEDTPVAIFVKDCDGRYISANRSCEQLWRKPRAEVIGKTDHDILSAADADRLRANDRQVMDTGAPGQFEEAVDLPGGTRVFLSSKTPFYDASGELRGLCGISTDITERHANRAKLIESENRFRLLADSAPVLIWMTDIDKQGVYFNRTWLEFTGRTMEQESGEGWLAAVHPDDIERLSVCQHAFEAREPFLTQFRLRRADGQYRWLLDQGTPRYSPDGEFLGFIGSCLDITTMKESEDALRISQQQLREQASQLAELHQRKDDFLAVLAHELRNPLAPIRHAAELMSTPSVRDEQCERAATIVQRQVSHMARLIDDLMDAARLSRGRIELRATHVDIATVFERAREIIEPELQSRGHRLELTLPAQSMVVYGDPDRLVQVLGNLLENAARYSDRPSIVWLEAQQVDGRARIIVRDQGRGITSDKLTHLFEPFVREGVPHQSSSGGLGLGLAIVKQLVDLHGGTIDAQSDGADKGSIFTVDLPLADGEQPVEQPTDRDGEPGHLRRILVVDDNQDAAELLSDMLEMDGHRVSVCFRGLDVVDQVRNNQTEIVLLDIGLPDLDGYQVAERLRAEYGQALKLIAVTGYGQEADRQRAEQAGFDHHMVKPMDFARLRSLLAE